MEGGLTPTFNELSMLDRWKLKSAALMKTATGIIRDDTKAHPGRFPLYAAYLVIMTVPVPEFGISIGLSLLALAWVKLRLTNWSRWMDDRLTAAFNEKALIDEHRAFIEPDKKHEGKFRVKNIDLVKATHRQTLADSGIAWHAAWDGFTGLFSSNKPKDPPPEGPAPAP